MFQSFIESLARFVYKTSAALETNGIEVRTFTQTDLNCKGYPIVIYGVHGSPEEGFL